MNWPLVSRARYDAAVTEANKMHTLAQSAMRLANEERERAHKLMDRLIEMKREGFVSPPALPEPAPQADPLPREVAQAITDLGLRGHDRYQTEAWARQALAGGDTPAKVAHRIWMGGQLENVA